MIRYKKANGIKKAGATLVPFLNGKLAVEGVDFVDTMIEKDTTSCGGWETDLYEMKGKKDLQIVGVEYRKHAPKRIWSVLDIEGNEIWSFRGYTYDMPEKPRFWGMIREVEDPKNVEFIEGEWEKRSNDDFV